MKRTKYLPNVVLLLVVLVAGCAARRNSVYEPPREVQRDSARAEQLTRKAAPLVNSDPESAERLLRQALTADLYHGPAHNNLGVLYLNRGDLYEAAHEFEWAGKLMPGHPDPRMNLALTLERAGRIDKAMEAYATALEVYPNHLPTIQAVARLQVRYDRTDGRTPEMLEEIALRGDTQQWRDWATYQITRLEP